MIKPAHGGARRGAGRRPTGRKPYTITLPPALIARTDALALKSGTTRSFVIESALESYL